MEFATNENALPIGEPIRWLMTHTNGVESEPPSPNWARLKLANKPSKGKINSAFDRVSHVTGEDAQGAFLAS